MTEENYSSSDDEEALDDDKVLGQVLNHYQAKHSIINEGGSNPGGKVDAGSSEKKDDAEFFNYLQEGANEENGESGVSVDSKLLMSDPSGEGQALLE